MLSKLTLLFGLLSSLVQVSQSQVVDCAAGKSLFQINSQGFDPNPPVIGENATLWIDYTVPDGMQVDSGSAKYSISLNGIPFPSSTDDLCTQIECPQTPGSYNISSASVWDGGVSGKIVSKIQWYDPAGKELLCSQTTFRTGFSNVKKYLRSSKPFEYSRWPFGSSFSHYGFSGFSSGSSASSGSGSINNSSTVSSPHSSSVSSTTTSCSPCTYSLSTYSSTSTQLTHYRGA